MPAQNGSPFDLTPKHT